MFALAADFKERLILNVAFPRNQILRRQIFDLAAFVFDV